MPGWASIANQVFVKFLERQPHARSDLRPPAEPVQERMSRALDTLAELVHDPSIGHRGREEISSMSFSRISPQVQGLQTENFMHASKDSCKAFSPLGADGRPMRRCVAC